MQRALAECRDLPPVEPSEDFLPRLQHRLYHIDDAGRLTARNHLGSAALVAVASVGFLALSWLPFATQMSVEIELPRVAVQVPGPALPTPSLFRAEPRALSVTDYWVPLSPTLDASPDLFGPGFRSIDGVVRPVALFEPAFVADLESSR